MQPLVYFYPEGHEAHRQAGHPERPERVEAIKAALRQAGWWEDFPKLAAAPISPEVLQTVHHPAYLSMLRQTCQRGGQIDGDTYTTPASWQIAQQSAGGAIAAALAVWRGEAQRGMALCRPPGHHAIHGQGMGFCLLNNIALAAETLIQNEAAQKLAIVDLDLHHGNGSEEIFWQRQDVFFLSVHQSPLYPFSGRLDETGGGRGEGYSANFPMPPGSGDEAYSKVMDELILPLLERYKPQMILVSYGFDTHWRDPLGSLLLSARAYGQLISRLTAWADAHAGGRISVFLEGGYDLEAAAACSQAVAAALLGRPWDDPLGPAPESEGTLWRKMVARARSLWNI